jgi:hypothetical protein
LAQILQVLCGVVLHVFGLSCASRA